VLQGDYRVRISYRGDTAYCRLRVEADPRKPYDEAGMKERQEKVDELLTKLGELNRGLTRIRKCKKTFTLVEELAGKDPSESMKESMDRTRVSLDSLSSRLFRDSRIQGIYSPPDALYVKLSGRATLITGTETLTENQLQKQVHYLAAAEEAIGQIRQFLEEDWAAFREAVEQEGISLFGDF
jgi:hypothetical protein